MKQRKKGPRKKKEDNEGNKKEESRNVTKVAR